MRISLLFLVCAALIGVADAHTLPAGNDVAAQLSHQLVAPHHVLATVVIAAAIAAIWRHHRKLSRHA